MASSKPNMLCSVRRSAVCRLSARARQRVERDLLTLARPDNMYEKGKSSRMLIVGINSTTMRAKELWEWKTGEYTPEFGDNDRLPSGNLLGCYWISDYNVTEWSYEGFEYDTRVLEIVRSTKLPAWRFSVQGSKCKNGVCDLESKGTWKVYSAERVSARRGAPSAILARAFTPALLFRAVLRDTAHLGCRV